MGKTRCKRKIEELKREEGNHFGRNSKGKSKKDI